MTDVEEAVEAALNERPDRNFTESVDLAINLRDLDLSQPDNRIDEDMVLPRGTGKDIKVAVIADGEVAVRAEEVADRVIRPDELDELGDDQDRAKDVADSCDFFIGQEELMPQVASNLGQVLGPRGKMPSERDVITPEDDVVEEVRRLKGSITLRSGDRRTFHTTVGTVEMPVEDLADNVDAVVRRLNAILNKGELNVDSLYVKTTMGPAVEVM